MGQYHIIVNLDRREYLDPLEMGSGMKLLEQLGTHPSTAHALFILCTALPVYRGGGDIVLPDDIKEEDKVVGRWAGNRIAVVGDYAERTDLTDYDNADLIYLMCTDEEEVKHSQEHLANYNEEKANRMKIEMSRKPPYKNITHLLRPVLADIFDGKWEERGAGWTWVTTKEPAKKPSKEPAKKPEAPSFTCYHCGKGLTKSIKPKKNYVTFANNPFCLKCAKEIKLDKIMKEQEEKETLKETIPSEICPLCGLHFKSYKILGQHLIAQHDWKVA